MTDMVAHQEDGALLSTQDVSRALGVSERTVQRLAASGCITRVRLGHRTVRYTPESVATLIVSENSEGRATNPANARKDVDAAHGPRDGS